MRVRILSGPWSERIGCVGTIVAAPAGYDRYPWAGRLPIEVIVLLDNDPMACAKRGCTHGPDRFVSCHVPDDPPWTCAIDRKHLEAL